MKLLTFLLCLVGMSAHATPVFQPQPLAAEAYGEAYTAVASLEDGSFVLVQLMFSNAGIGSRKAACRALWVPPGKAGINASTKMDADAWSYEASTDLLTAGQCSLGTQGQGLRFSTKLAELEVVLDIQAKARAVRPPGHRIDAQQSFYEAEILVPAAPVTATIQSGGQTLNTKGSVHIDHSRSNILMPNAAACWMRFRGFFGAQPTLIQVRVPPGGGTPDGWTWPLSSSAPTKASQFKIGKNDRGQPVLTLTSSAGDVKLEATRQLYRYRPTESYGALGRLASPWIGDPTTTTYRAKATTNGGATVSGILETLEVDDPGCVAQ